MNPNLSAPSLHQRVVATTAQLESWIAQIPDTDPLKGWFLFELQRFGKTAAHPQQPLLDDNAQLRGLLQLEYLIQQHVVRKHNLGAAQAAKRPIDSIGTVQSRVPANVVNAVRETRFSIAPNLLHQPAEASDQFDPVSPTAKVVGVLRAADPALRLLDAPTLLAEGEQLLRDLAIVEPATRGALQVLFQSRFHAINAALGQTGVAQIVEFAAGISPRGVQWARSSPGTIYVESDLPQLILRKAKLIRNSLLTDVEPLRGVLHCCGVDVLNAQSVGQALASLDTHAPFAIVTEGLLLYFDDREMQAFVQVMREVLTKFPQARWVTDLVTQANLAELGGSRPGVAQAVRQVFGLAGRNAAQTNPFRTDRCVAEWLHASGLDVVGSLPLHSVASLAKPEHPLDAPHRAALVGTRNIWQIAARPIQSYRA